MDLLTPEFMTIAALYISLGALVGFCAGLLGVGGGALMVPGLYYVEKHIGHSYADSALMAMALATSMSIIIPTGMSSSWAQIKRKAVRWDAFKLMVPGLVVGVCMGVFVVSKLENETLRMIFSVGLYAMAVMTLMKKENALGHPQLLRPYVAYPAGSIIGLIATMMGIAGAMLNVPYLNRAGIPLHNAIATSSVLGVMVALPAALGFMVSGMADGGVFSHINITAWLLIVPVSVIVAPWGVKASHALPVKKLKYIFVALMVVLATKMLLET